VQWALSMTEHLISGFLHIWNWIPSRFNMSWNDLFANSFPLSVGTQMGRLASLIMVLNAFVTDLPVLDNRGTVL